MADIHRESILVRASSWFFRRWKVTLSLWLVLIISGGVIYTNIIKREGFPPIQFPLTVVSGTYFVDDVKTVDQDVTGPIAGAISKLDSVESSQVNAGANFFSVITQFKSDVVPQEGTDSLRKTIDALGLPKEARYEYTTIDPAAFLNKYDLLLSVYSTNVRTSAEALQQVAQEIALKIDQEETITAAETQNLVTEGINPATGRPESRQTAYSKIGLTDDGAGELQFYPAITIGVDRDSSKIDIIELSELMNRKLSELDMSGYGDEYRVVIGSDFASSINTQISSLQSNLFGGLLAVAVVSMLLISWRASLITGIFMVTVMAVVIATLYLVGYTLNTITLFALVLSLGLFVDDATIVVEALDANRRKKKKAQQIVTDAVTRVGAASFAGTMTTVLVFLPLAFISGILGEFIRLMPITIIISLIASFVLSLTLIPLLSRFVMLNEGKTSPRWAQLKLVSRFETVAGKFVGDLPRLLIHNKTKGRFVALSMVLMSIAFFGLAMNTAGKLSFNIFPQSKDSDQIGVQISYPPQYDLEQAEDVADKLNSIISAEIGNDAKRVTYGSFDQPNERSADVLIELSPFNERDTKSPILIEKLQSALDDSLGEGVAARVIQYDAGPPADEYPFKMQVFSDDESQALAFAQEMREYLDQATVTRANGSTAQITKVKLPNKQSIQRKDGKRLFQIEAAFDASDTSALVMAAQTFVETKITPQYAESFGLSLDDITYDFGQESSNEDSFSSLAIIFPVAILMMYILLALQFKSFLQPLLIFMAIPFSLFGVFGGLYATDNSLSFFSMIGLIGLIGIAVNNSILLTDYANQEKRRGAGSIEAISNAATKRFRPLITTTLTTVVALLPLALTDPFWEALAVTIMFGLLSSTFLVIFSFPYFYLATEWIRKRARKLVRKAIDKKRK